MIGFSWILKPLLNKDVATLISILIICIATQPAAALRLPLDGYCRPGRYFPIEVGPPASTTFTAAGALDVEIEANPNPRIIVPMLVIDTPGDLRWPGGSLPLRVPGDRERLVATTENAIDAAELFPGKRILPIHLDTSDPLPGPPAAWEALDAIVLDADAMARLTPGQRSALLAAGVMLAVPNDRRPDDHWPWQKHGSFWVLHYAPLGPVDQLISTDAYAPTFGWFPGRSARVRVQIAAVAVLMFLATVALAMLRNRWAVPGLIALSLGSAAGIAIWQHALGTVVQAGGDVIVVNSTLTQRDQWVFERASRTGDQIIPWAGWTHPIFGSPDAATKSLMRITIAADGIASFHFQLDRGKTMAFVRREVQPGQSPPTTPTRASPMRESAKAIYLGPGDKITGETPEINGRWAGAVIRRNAE